MLPRSHFRDKEVPRQAAAASVIEYRVGWKGGRGKQCGLMDTKLFAQSSGTVTEPTRIPHSPVWRKTLWACIRGERRWILILPLTRRVSRIVCDVIFELEIILFPSRTFFPQTNRIKQTLRRQTSANLSPSVRAFKRIESLFGFFLYVVMIKNGRTRSNRFFRRESGKTATHRYLKFSLFLFFRMKWLAQRLFLIIQNRSLENRHLRKSVII